MNAAIPDSLRQFVLTRVTEGGFASVDEYVGRLVQADLERSSQGSLEDELLRGLSGDRLAVTTDDFDRLRETIRSRYADEADRR